MSNTITAENAGNTTAEAGSENQEAAGSRTFTQEEVNSMLAKERRETQAKSAGYEDFKAKAEEFDKQQEASKTELEKANDKLAKANAELDALKAEKEHAAIVAQVAKETGVALSVVESLNGTDLETLKAQAEAIAEQYKQPAGAPSVPEAGKFPGEESAKKSTAQLFAEAINEARKE